MRSFRHTLGPLLLILVCPPAAILFWYTAHYLDGSFSLLFTLFQKHGALTTLFQIWAPVFFGSKTSWAILAVFASTELLFMRFLPGKKILGPETKHCFTPIYKENGPLALFLTIFLFCICSFGFKLFSPTILYNHFGELISSLSLFSLFFCLFLYCKGRFFPSGPDHSVSGNFIFDYYWGTELYPLIFGWHVKQFTNCRFGMMSWPIILLSFGAAQHELYGLSNTLCISIFLQFIYIIKFFFWESGYLRSLDIMHDRAGFYICWGCLVWVPAIYTSPALYLVNHPSSLSPFLALLLTTVGFCAIITNFLADRQRTLFRESKGNIQIWGKKPNYTVAAYETDDGVQKENLLLASGFWGIARHFHYVPEIFGAFLWSLPGLFSHFYPYFYVCFLTILLFDRARRDDRRCSSKYKESWSLHCEKVPYKIIPFVY